MRQAALTADMGGGMVLDAVLYAAPCWCSSLLACLPRMRAWYPEEWSGVDPATTDIPWLVELQACYEAIRAEPGENLIL